MSLHTDTRCSRLVRLAWLSVFALAMAYLEAAVVVYLRELYYASDPLNLFPLQPFAPHDLAVELARELATLVMIVAVARLAEPGLPRSFAATLYLFGLWDLGYYLWLKVILGWPVHWLEWDILFLIPWLWLGPWLTAAAIAALLTAWGGWVLTTGRAFTLKRLPVLLFIGGTLLALAAFLAPGWPLLGADSAGLSRFTPTHFPWAVFIPGYLLMAAGLSGSLLSGHRHDSGEVRAD